MMRKQAYLQTLLDALAEHIRVRRKALGWTQEQLAENAGLSTNYIARLELGTNTPSLPTLVRLSMALSVPVSHLLALEVAQEWQDPAQEIAHALELMGDTKAKFVIDQLRAIVGFVESMED